MCVLCVRESGRERIRRIASGLGLGLEKHMTVTIKSIVKRWNDPKARPLFKSKLIDDNGCCCAQGDVLRCAGWTNAQLREMTQTTADSEVSKILGISRAHAVLLRQVNDSANGCPQDVLTNPKKILGPNARVVLAFWRHLDTLGESEWQEIAAEGDVAEVAAGAAARTAAGECMGISALAKPYFLKLFFPDVSAWLASIE